MRLSCLAGSLLACCLMGCDPDSAPLGPLPLEPPLEPTPPPTHELPTWVDVPASDPRLQYIGRMEPSPEGQVYGFPGGTVRLLCDCTDVDLLFEDLGTGGEQHTNFIDVRVDGESAARVELTPGVRLHSGARGLTPGPHRLELVKRTEAYAGRVRFLGLRVRGVLLEPPPPPTERLEFIGDSITCGYGNEVSLLAPHYTEPNTGYHARNQDISQAYGPLTARALGAEWVTTCVSGRGVYRNNDGSHTGVLPLVYEHVLPEERSPRWEPARYVPDVIVLNLGTNDFSVLDGARLPSAPPSESFTFAYAAFVRTLRQLHPRATIVCAVGPMLSDTYPSGRQLWTLQRRYVSDVVTRARAAGDDNVHFLAFTPLTGDPYGEDWHPTAAHHARMAGELTAFLKGLASAPGD